MSQPTAESNLPTSYWHATFSPPVPEDPLPVETQVAVIGGGLLGCWTAYWLAQQGVDVTLVERNVISWGATGRNGGFLMGGGAMGYASAIDMFGRDTARAIWTLAAEGQHLAAQVVADEDIDCDFRTPGTLSLALSDDGLEHMRHNLDLMHEDGFGGEMFDREDVQALVHTPLASEITGGVFSAPGSLLHSGRYLAGIAIAAKSNGARLCRATVTGLGEEGDGVAITTESGTIRASRVIVAVNAWTDELVPALKDVIVPVRGQILSYEPLPRVFETGLGADVSPTGEYWQQTPDGSILLGGCRADAPHGDVDVREMVPTPDVTANIERVLPRLFPHLDEVRVARRWAGLMAFTSDYLPVAGAAPDVPHTWIAGGFCGHGMPFGPRVGQLLAEAATSGETPDALVPLRLGRPTLTRLQTPGT